MNKEIVAYIPVLDKIITLKLLKSKNIRVRCLPAHTRLIASYLRLGIKHELIHVGEL